LFIVVVTRTDRLTHLLWDAFDDETHRYHKPFLDYFTKVDSFVDLVYNRLLDVKISNESSRQLNMLSDHGFTGIKAEVCLNRWLQENQYLKFAKVNPETIMDIGPGSTAFAMDPSPVCVNVKGKFPLEIVDRFDCEKVRQELRQGIEGQTFEDGSKIRKRVYSKEKLCDGSDLDQAPDLAVLSHRRYDL
jgi:predicted AlkP superfamily phosphohydrolase/phosphomutase